MSNARKDWELETIKELLRGVINLHEAGGDPELILILLIKTYKDMIGG